MRTQEVRTAFCPTSKAICSETRKVSDSLRRRAKIPRQVGSDITIQSRSDKEKEKETNVSILLPIVDRRFFRHELIDR